MSRAVSCLAAVVLGALFIHTTLAGATAPFGQPPKDAKEAYAQAAVVFVGTVAKVSKDQFGYPSLAQVRVAKCWKGLDLLGTLVEVDGRGGPTYPARVFAADKSYLFYLPAPQAKGKLRADKYLHRVVALGEAAEDLRYLSQFPAQELK